MLILHSPISAGFLLLRRGVFGSVLSEFYLIQHFFCTACNATVRYVEIFFNYDNY